MKEKIPSITIGDSVIEAGEKKVVELSVAPMYTHDDLSITVQVIRSKKPGPVLFLSAALHGDEINGVEIIRRVLKHSALKRLRGTLLAIPIVNVYGFLHHDRYLPDGRDINRSFPGSTKGSLTGRVAHTFINEIVSKCSHGIDLHTGARHRSNFPQIRADLDDSGALAMTEAFGVPLAIHARTRDGSLRECAGDMGISVILYEAGEALRFDEMHIRAGVKGVLNVMRAIDMLPANVRGKLPPKPTISGQTSWMRAPASGILRTLVRLGANVAEGQLLGLIGDPLGEVETEIHATCEGMVIGGTNLPLVYEGDAIFHIAQYGRATASVVKQVEKFREENTHDVGELTSATDIPIA